MELTCEREIYRERASVHVAFKLYFVSICIYVPRNTVTDSIYGADTGVWACVSRLCLNVIDFISSLLTRGCNVGGI